MTYNNNSGNTSYWWLMIGLSIYCIGTAFDFWGGNSTYFRILGVIVIFYQLLFRTSKSVFNVDISISLYFIWQIIIASRGAIIGNFFENDGSLYRIFHHLFTSKNSALVCFLPLLACINYKTNHLFEFRKLNNLMVVIYFILLIAFLPHIIQGDSGYSNITMNGEEVETRNVYNTVSFGIIVIVFFSWISTYCDNDKFKRLLLVILCVNPIFHILGGGRGASFNSLLFLIINIIFLFVYSKQRKQGSSGVAVLILLVLLIIGFKYIIENTQIASYLFSRTFDSEGALGNTRRETSVVGFLDDFKGDYLSWAFGRGINGSYYAPDFYLTPVRYTIEYGFMWLILKGGIINLLLYVWVHLKAIKLALKKSNNYFMKAIGIFILFNLYSLIPFGIPSIDFQHFLAWWFIGLTHNSYLREATNQDIKSLLYRI